MQRIKTKNISFFKHKQTIMVNYKDLGLVNTREMFKKAVAGGYAIPAFNFNTMEQMQAIGARKIESPRNVISLAKTAPKMVVDDDFTAWAEANGRDDLLTYKQPEPNKSAIKEAIQSGAEIPFAHIEEGGQSLRIR